MKGMIGKKVGMTQVFDDQGTVVPVTVIQAGPCYVTQIRNRDRDGYVSVQLGYGEAKPTRLTKGQLGHLQKSDLPALRHLREFRMTDNTELAVEEGQEIKVDIFEQGDFVDVIGASKGTRPRRHDQAPRFLARAQDAWSVRPHALAGLNRHVRDARQNAEGQENGGPHGQ